MDIIAYQHLFSFLILLLLYYLIIEIISYSGKLMGVKEWTLSYIFFFFFSISEFYIVQHNYFLGATISIVFFITALIYVQYSIAKYNNLKHNFWFSLIFGFILVMYSIMNSIFTFDSGRILIYLFSLTMMIVSIETIVFIRNRLALKGKTKMYFPMCITMSLFIVVYVLRIVFNVPFGVQNSTTTASSYINIFTIILVLSVSLSLNYIYKWFYINELEQYTAFQDKKITNIVRDSELDSLTKVYNRKKIEEIINIYIHKSLTSRDSFSFVTVLIDLDNFKFCNDFYGHDYGDRVLQHFCVYMQNKIRKTDVFARWGGDEFIVVLPDISLKDAHYILKKIQRENIRVEGGIDFKINYSYGLEKYNPSYTYETYFKEIDKRMYLDKNNSKTEN